MAKGIRVTLRSGSEERIQELAGETIAELAQRVKTTAQRLVPYLSGDLHNSITVEESEDAQGPCAYVYAGGTAEVDYEGHVENGTSRQAAQPYMVPALYQTRVL